MKSLKKELSKINKKHWDIIFANPKEYSKLYDKYISDMQELMIGYTKAKIEQYCKDRYGRESYHLPFSTEKWIKENIL